MCRACRSFFYQINTLNCDILCLTMATKIYNCIKNLNFELHVIIFINLSQISNVTKLCACCELNMLYFKCQRMLVSYHTPVLLAIRQIITLHLMLFVSLISLNVSRHHTYLQVFEYSLWYCNKSCRYSIQRRFTMTTVLFISTQCFSSTWLML